MDTITNGDRPKSVPRFRDDFTRWFEHNKRDFPWRRSGMSPWQILLLEMCLHRTWRNGANGVDQGNERLRHVQEVS